jgi:putative membrane protein
MATAAQVFTVIVALLHVYFLVLEMFLWTTPYAQKTFGRTAKEQEESKVLAANQGLYNGFLVAGIAWSLYTGAVDVRLFFLGCVVVAGIYGAATASKKILFAQALPGGIAFALTYVVAHV